MSRVQKGLHPAAQGMSPMLRCLRLCCPPQRNHACMHHPGQQPLRHRTHLHLRLHLRKEVPACACTFAQVPHEIASCWGGSSSGGGALSGLPGTAAADGARSGRGLGLGLDTPGPRPLSMSLPARPAPAALSSPFGPPATDPCLHPDAAMAAAAAAAGFATSPHMHDRLPGAFSDAAASPWCVGVRAHDRVGQRWPRGRACTRTTPRTQRMWPVVGSGGWLSLVSARRAGVRQQHP